MGCFKIGEGAKEVWNGVTDTFCIRASAMGLALQIHVILPVACLILVVTKAATNKPGKIKNLKEKSDTHLQK